MKLLQYSLFGFTFIFLFTVLCPGQEKIRSVEKEFESNKVIDLVELRVKDKKFKLNEGFSSDSDWIKNLTARFKNISDKAISYAEINLVIRPVGNMKLPVQLKMRYGMTLDLGELIDKEAIKNYSQKIKPGETFDVSITESNKIFFDKIVKENQTDVIEHAEISPDFIIFENSRAWSVGHEMLQDVENPSVWKVIGIWQADGSVIRKKKL